MFWTGRPNRHSLTNGSAARHAANARNLDRGRLPFGIAANQCPSSYRPGRNTDVMTILSAPCAPKQDHSTRSLLAVAVARPQLPLRRITGWRQVLIDCEAANEKPRAMVRGV